jgi:hypothetical protein
VLRSVVLAAVLIELEDEDNDDGDVVAAPAGRAVLFIICNESIICCTAGRSDWN